MNTHVAVICNYQLKENRIGSMDRFFLAFDKACNADGFIVDWFFPKSKKIEIYKEINFHSNSESNVEVLFLNYIEKNQVNYKYVFTHFIELFIPFFKVIKRKLNCKVFAVDHMSRPMQGYSLNKKIKKKIKYYLYRGNIDKIIAVSEYIKNQNLKDFSPCLSDKIEVIYNGIQIEQYKERNVIKNKREAPLNFIVVSHLVYEKGIQDLILALSKLDEKILEKIKIDIYGEGIYESTLINMVTEFNLEATLCFKGSVSNLNNMYMNYDYMIQPTYMEAFSLSILESLCCNVPVITTSVGGNVEVVVEGVNGYLFHPKKIDDICRILTNICTNKVFLKKSNFSSDIREKYNLKKMVNNYLKFLPCI